MNYPINLISVTSTNTPPVFQTLEKEGDCSCWQCLLEKEGDSSCWQCLRTMLVEELRNYGNKVEQN